MGDFYYCFGKLKVYPKGYWFTAGGEKGSFGYYPHLKDLDGSPLYPDTQIKGDVRMAHEWYENIYSGSDLYRTDNLFGDEGNTPSKLFFSDLKVNEKFGKCWEYEIKTRIKVDEERGVVEEHMLANFEMARFTDSTNPLLISNVILYNFDDPDELEKCKRQLEESVKLLSGFGALRSRGYGRGRCELEWEDTKSSNFDGELTNNYEDRFIFSMKSLTNFRNKPIYSGESQLVSGNTRISSSQFRAWLSNIWNKIYDE